MRLQLNFAASDGSVQSSAQSYSNVILGRKKDDVVRTTFMFLDACLLPLDTSNLRTLVLHACNLFYKQLGVALYPLFNYLVRTALMLEAVRVEMEMNIS